MTTAEEYFNEHKSSMPEKLSHELTILIMETYAARRHEELEKKIEQLQNIINMIAV